MFDVCERLVPPRAVGAHTIHESYPVWCERGVNIALVRARLVGCQSAEALNT